MSASPEKFFKLIGPLCARAVSLPFTSYREIGPFIVSNSMEADFGARISKYTVQSSSSAGPLVDTRPFSVDMVICERIRSAASPEPAAALHAVTEYVSLSQPTTCTPPFSCGCTCRTASSDFVSVLSSDWTTASRSSNWMRRSEQSVIGYLWPPRMLTEWRCEAAFALVKTMRASRTYAEIRKARLRLDMGPLPAAIDDGSPVWSRRLPRFQSQKSPSLSAPMGGPSGGSGLRRCPLHRS